MNEQAQQAAGGFAALMIMLMPIFKEYSPLVFGALVGVMHPVSKIVFPDGWEGKRKAALYMLKWILTAALLTGFVATVVQKYTGFPATVWPEIVAFVIAFLADDWYTIKGRTVNAIFNRFAAKGGQQ